jgi:Flp pilus assembly protein TadD
MFSQTQQLLQTAMAYHRAGDLARADAIYAQVLAEDPTSADALHLRGVVAYQRGDYPMAIAAIQQSLMLSGNNPSCLNNLGLAYQAMGRLTEAEAAFQTALNLAPNLAEAMSNLGILRGVQGRWTEAETWCRQAIRLDPRLADAYNGLGRALWHQGKSAEAIANYRTALAVNPRLPFAMVNLGTALRAQGNLAEAETLFRQAIALDPNVAEAHNSLAIVLATNGAVAEAVTSYREALRLNPNQAGVHHNLGHAYRDLGQFEDAQREYLTALSLEPGDAKVYNSLSLIHRFTSADQATIDQMEALASHELPPFEARQLHFALGKVYDDLKQYDRALAHYRKANEVYQGGFDREPFIQLVKRMEAWFPKGRFVAGSDSGNPSEMPVFIVGMPRSGTTLIEQILASHPLIYGCGELADMDTIANDLSRGMRTQIEVLPPPPGLSNIPHLTELAEGYLQRRRVVCGNALRFTSKMPTNYYHLGVVALLFPKARVIHCRRSPLDTCLSCYFSDFIRSATYHYRLDDLGFYYQLYQRMMAHWRSVLPLPMLEIRYEDLASRPEEISRRMVEFCGLEWDDRCMRYYDNRRPVQTSSVWQVRQPIYTTSIGRWRHYVEHLRPLIEALGPEGKAEAQSNLSAGGDGSGP